MLGYLFACLAACANAVSSVAQRKANMDLPGDQNMSWRLIRELLHKRIWFLGVLGIIAGFGLQAAALSSGPLAAVESTLIIELPLTLILAGKVFGRHLAAREWLNILAITVGLAALLYFLDPTGGIDVDVPGWTWFIGGVVNLAVIAALVIAARRAGDRDQWAAALLGVAAGAGFGLTAAFIKAVTGTAQHEGLTRVLSTWQTYAMIATGFLALFLVQSALHKGPLVAAQPGFTVGDPLVSILWGVLAFQENTGSRIDLALAAIAAVVLGWGVVRLSRSPILREVSEAM